jgi:cytochrome b561/polyisoprenoid-binding protein YceI
VTAVRYSLWAIGLHWAIAGLLVFQLGMGFALDHQPRGEAMFAAYQLHKSFGISILLLSSARLALRLLRPPPPAEQDQGWQPMLAKAVHAGFYVLIILGPLSGWIIVSTSKVSVPTLLFGALALPHLPVPQSWHDPASAAHSAMVWIAAALILLHLAGVARHQFFKGHNILQRMLPMTLGNATRAPLAGLVAVVLLAGLLIWGNRLSFDMPRVAVPASPLPVTVVPPRESPNAAIDEVAKAEADETDGANADKKGDVGQPLTDWAIAAGGTLDFTARWSGSDIHGKFGDWSGKIRFSPDDLAGSTIAVKVRLASASLGDPQREEMLASSSFFDVKLHPTATFTSSEISHLKNNRYRAKGQLTLHGAKRPTLLDFRLDIKGDRATVQGHATIDRTRFGVGSGEWSATDELAAAVDVRFDFTASTTIAD